MLFRPGSSIPRPVVLLVVAGAVALLVFGVAWAQNPQQPPPQAYQQSGPLLAPDQLDNLVAPIALYPDPLLSQVLAASTYPLEVVEAEQWLRANGNLSGQQLIDAAREQNWDPSVQALVAFPDALRLLSSDVRWTTDLGNAFLDQQADVMSAVQRMRARARANGRLNSSPQQVVTTDVQNGQSAIEIVPANPQVVYVPVYDPAYIWGPPVWGYYPDLWYPGYAFGFGFGPGIYIDAFFPGLVGWGGWGWGCGWFGNGIFLNTGFFHRFGFHDRFHGGFGGGFDRGFGGRNFGGGRVAWSHDPGHRMGVPYNSAAVANRFHGQFAANRGQFGGQRGQFGGQRGQFGGARANNFANRAAIRGGGGGFANRSMGANAFRSPSNEGWQRFNGNRAAGNSFAPGAHGGSQAFRAPAQSYRGFNSASNFGNQGRAYNRPFAPAYSAPRQNFGGARQGFSAGRQSFTPRQNFAAPRQNFAPRQSFSAPRSFSAPPRGGGFSGGHSGFQGGHAGGFAGGGHAGNFSGGGHAGGFAGGHGGGFSGGHGGGGGGGHRR